MKLRTKIKLRWNYSVLKALFSVSADHRTFIGINSQFNSYGNFFISFSLANGMILGSHCESTCDRRLINVFCNPQTKKCECEKNYPVKLGNYANCVTAHL